ncbi:acyltransferase [Desulfoprunum benzoelyticum]|uniref:Peptidoglycan/LPS O-acetylase OafA/YrhL n=1 Tax=Desulfoprunum benzoelyticum TaxID=1506996 RepID=A0A840V0P4_9BACT|nr:acyltransferase [Desulfoprunum benzoelyticum]MBB5347390.1 peptidoglycan/LPS O-acetylase OafA/YrhL [Desulfoprunum benzoelyticum]MBM9530932.1 acyltransferase [Desulfoprunum benzoelyticum]
MNVRGSATHSDTMQINRSHPLWKIAAALLFFLLIRQILSYIALSSYFSATVDADFDHPDVIDIYYASSAATFREEHRQSSEAFTPGLREKKQIDLTDGVARKIRIDLGGQGGQVKLYSLRLKSHFGGARTFDARQIFDGFTPANGIESYTLEGDHVLVHTTGVDPHIVLKGKLREENAMVGTFLPAVYALAFLLLLSHANLAAFPAIADLQGKSSSIGLHLGSLDGVRGVAALMVLAEHTGLLRGIGSLGVWLFFCLSGFLLAAPFITEPSRAVSPRFMATYLVRRMKRILPMYYAVLAASLMFSGKTDQFIRHILFLQGDGHLWTLPQEMFFYLVLPLVVAAIYLLCRGNRLLAVFFLLLLLVVANRYMSTRFISLYGYGKKLEPMIGIFLSGMMFAYLYHWLGSNRLFLKLDRTHVRRFCSLAGLILLALLLVLSARLVPAWAHVNALKNPGTFGFAAGLFILLLVLANNTLLSRIMSFLPLRAVGLVGFSYYLLHPTLLNFIRTEFQDYFGVRLSGLPMFVLAGLATYGLAAFTYTYIERPFLRSTAATPPQQQQASSGSA